MPEVDKTIEIFDADGALSREYLLDRGYCCENGCRNCPYGFKKPEAAVPVEPVVAGAFNLDTCGTPRRIVSLCPSNTEILHALGLIDRIVGVDDYSDWPPEIATKPRLGPDLHISMERLDSLVPDLVLASLSVPGMDRIAAQLRDRDLPHIVLDPQSLAGIWESMRIVADIAGVEGVDTVIDGFKHRIAAVKQAQKNTRQPRLYWEWWPKPLYCPGKRNWLTEISEIAGGVNVTGDIDVRSAQPSMDDVVNLAPDFIFLVWTGVEASKVRPDVVTRRPGWSQIPAVRDHRIYVLEEGLFCRPSPKLIDGLEQLTRILNDHA